MQHAQEASASTTEPKRGRQWHNHPTVRFLFVALVLWGLYIGYGYLTGPGRITDCLHARLAQHPATVDVLVTPKFPPEEFHIRLFQQVGSMRGVEGSTAKLYAVTPANVRFLSRHYWIQRIDLAADTAQEKCNPSG